MIRLLHWTAVQALSFASTGLVMPAAGRSGSKPPHEPGRRPQRSNGQSMGNAAERGQPLLPKLRRPLLDRLHAFPKGRLQGPAAQPEHLDMPGVIGPIEIRRHPAARRVSLRVSTGQRRAILTLPMRASLNGAKRFIAEHTDWLNDRLRNVPEAIWFADGATIPLRGVACRIVFTGNSRSATLVRVVHNGPPDDPAATRELHVSGSQEAAPGRLHRWLIEQARKDIEGRVRLHARRLNLEPKRITIRDQTSRWGSCSSTGALSFSWRLIFAPPFVLDYVSAHEVAHLREMNHGPQFWAQVRKTLPDMERGRAWLQLHGAELHRYSPPPR